MSEAMTDQLAAALDNLFKLRYDEDEGEWDVQEVDPRSLWPVLAAARSWLTLTDDENVEAGAKGLHRDRWRDHLDWEALTEGEQHDLIADAKAVLAAVRDRSTG